MENILSERISFVKSKLLSVHTIKVTRDWIFECVNFFTNQSQEITDDEIFQASYEQFLLADTKEASNPVIPASILQNKHSFTLYGNFVLQLQYLIDIAESPYDQHRRLHRKQLDAVEENQNVQRFKTKRKRVFKLCLTDGHKTINAMEYSTIPCLNSKLSPGTKLKVIGPLQVVNHIMLLESKNLQILGGDVEDLLIENAYENVLLRALNKPTTETPILEYEEEVLNEDINQSTNNVQQYTNLKPQPVQNVVAEIYDDEEDLDMETIMQLDQLAATVSRPEVQNNAEDTAATIQNVLSEDSMIMDSIYDEIVYSSQIPSSDSSEKLKVNDERNSCEGSRFAAKSSHECTDEPTLTKKVARIEPTRLTSTINDESYKFKSHSGDNMVTCDQYLSLKTGDKLKRCYVVCCTIRSVNNLRVKAKEYLLECDITDKYSKQLLTVNFDNNVVEELSGTSIDEMLLMYEEMKIRPHIKQDIARFLEKLQEKLKNLNCFMKIEMELLPSCTGCCKVVQLLNENESDKRIFLNKLKEENLIPVE